MEGWGRRTRRKVGHAGREAESTVQFELKNKGTWRFPVSVKNAKACAHRRGRGRRQKRGRRKGGKEAGGNQKPVTL